MRLQDYFQSLELRLVWITRLMMIPSTKRLGGTSRLQENMLSSLPKWLSLTLLATHQVSTAINNVNLKVIRLDHGQVSYDTKAHPPFLDEKILPNAWKIPEKPRALASADVFHLTWKIVTAN